MNHRYYVKFIVMLNIINVSIIVASAFLMPLWADFVARIGGDIQTAGNAIFIFSIVIGLMTYVAGHIESHFDHNEYFIVAAQLLMLFAYLGYFFIQHPWQLYLIQLTLGLGGAFQAPALYALYQRFIPDKKSNTYWGIWTGSYNIAIGVGALLSATIWHHSSYFVLFTVLNIIAFIGLLLCLALVRMLPSTAANRAS